MSRPTSRLVGALVGLVMLGAGFVLPGVGGQVALFLAAGVLPALGAAEWLLASAGPWSRTVVGLALGPLVASGLAIGPFAAGVPPATIVLGLGVLGAAAWALAPRRPQPSDPEPPARGWDAPPSRFVAVFALLVLVLLALPPLAHEWGRVKGDGWIHAGIVYELLERGLPPQDPRWAGQTLNYVWFYNFFIALLTGSRGGDPFTFMVIVNLADFLAFLGLVHLAAWTVWRDRRVAAAAVVLVVVGLNAGAWILWPLRVIPGLVGSVRGPEAIMEALRPPAILSWQVFYELSAPFAHMVNFIDKFTIGTALNQAWVQMMLAVWAVLAWVSGGPRALLVLSAAGTLGMLLFHGVVGLSAGPVLGLALVAAGAMRWVGAGRTTAFWPAGRMLAAGLALLAGAVAGLPYTRSISRGWDAGQTGMAHSYLVFSPMMAWTVLTSCGVVLALAWAPARRLLRGRHAAGTVIALFTTLMAGFAILVNLPEDNESKFAFQVFFGAVLLAAGAVLPAISRTRDRLGALRTGGIVVALFVLPPALTLLGLVFDLDGRARPHANLSTTERRFHAWLASATPPDAVVVDARFRDYAMVLARRQLYCGASLGPSRAGFPMSQVRERHAVMADLYGPAADLTGDAEKLARLGRPVVVLYREADFETPAGARILDRAPDLYRRVHDADGFVVYSLLPQLTAGGAR